MTNKTGRSNINPILLADFNVNNYKQAVFNKFGYYPPSV